MRLIYSPQRAGITYSVEVTGEVLMVTVNGQSDTFDFTNMPDGTTEGIDSVLSPCPVLRAERLAGELTVHLIHWHGPEPVLVMPGHFPPETEDPDQLAAYEDAYQAACAQAETDHAAALAAWQLETQVWEEIR